MTQAGGQEGCNAASRGANSNNSFRRLLYLHDTLPMTAFGIDGCSSD
jgi:hypothetical protein